MAEMSAHSTLSSKVLRKATVLCWFSLVVTPVILLVSNRLSPHYHLFKICIKL